MKITVVDINKNLIQKFKVLLDGPFKDIKDSISLKEGSFTEIPHYDAIVSPGNSFGFMGGGVDKALRTEFGVSLETRVIKHIQEEFLGEHNVGSAFVITTDNVSHPWLVQAPTMRVPQSIKGTDAVYRAVWAALIAVKNHNKVSSSKIDHLVFPGMGTGAGCMDEHKAAGQMLLAFKNFIIPTSSASFKEAYGRDNKLKSYI